MPKEHTKHICSKCGAQKGKFVLSLGERTCVKCYTGVNDFEEEDNYEERQRIKKLNK